MRNLKKILALVLALVMSLSLVTIASGADFTDADDIELTEAVEVMSTIGVLEGHDTGAFSPKGTLTREQAAKIITYMLLGTNADKLSIGTSRYSDVAVTRWSAPAIEYCATLGIIDGNGDGTFNPGGALTGYAFAKMLLTAIGYKSSAEGFTGAAWTVNVARYALEIGLDNGIEGSLVWGNAITREQAAQMALNTIRTPLVAYDDGATIIINGEKVSFGSGDVYYVTTTLAKEQRISEQTLSNTKEYTVEFGEKYFPNLRLISETDEFERPSHTWVYNSEEIGTYVDYDLLVETYTTGVTGEDLYGLLGRTTIAEYALYVYEDGIECNDYDKTDLVRNNDSELLPTGNGVLTQVFVDHDAEDIYITHINTYLAKANSDYNTRTETLSLEIYHSVTRAGNPVVATTNSTNKSVEYVDVPAVEGITEGTYVLVNMSGKDRGNTIAAMDVVKVFDVEVLTDTTITKFSQGGNDQDEALFSKVTADGEQYSASEKAAYNADVLNLYADGLLTDMSYNVYLDQYGYAIGVDLYEGELNYVFITGYDRGRSNISVKTATAAGIFLDGSMEEITVNVTATNKNIDAANDGNFIEWAGNGDPDLNRWYSYSVNSAGVYTLKPATRMFGTNFAQTTTINCSNVRLDDSWGGNGRAYGEDDSIFITVDTDSVDTLPNKAITEVTGLYTGVQNVEIEVEPNNGATDPNSCIYTLYDSNFFIIASIVVGDAIGSNANYAYILDTDASSEYIEDGVYYWEFDAIMDGQVVTLTATGEYADVFHTLRAAVGNVVELRFNTDEQVVSVKDNLSVYDETDYTNPINGEDVYDVDLPDGGIGELWLQGRTLYVTNNQSDRGLTFVADAKAVVIQDEDNKSVISEYGSVSEALSALADANTNTTELEYEGQITAVLDSLGRAVWVVFDNDNGLTSNSGAGTGSNNFNRVVMNNNGDINLFKGSTLVQDRTTAHDIELWRYSAGQNTFVKVYDNDDAYVWGQPAPFGALNPGDSYYVVIDGVMSNTIVAQ